jgi:hypothetical protein
MSIFARILDSLSVEDRWKIGIYLLFAFFIIMMVLKNPGGRKR